MKKMKKFNLDEKELVTVYERQDIEKMIPILKHAEQLWYDEWVRLGCINEGSCCGGKGIQLRYRAPRRRLYSDTTFIQSPPCQGNVSAYASVGPALEYLKSCEIEAEYFDGWMD